ncbi:hypothetical protein [Echinicola sp. 20G]|uniref:hypothetical protein n=1 Tax=Echinicola sp. 20G TaxID=2781961 RepID=UPI0019100F4D|nr:hypothetical protein [Echinicola sp. 20G]
MFSKISFSSKVLLLILFTVILVTGIDLFRISSYQAYPLKPEDKIDTKESQVYWELVKGTENIDWKGLDGTLEFIKQEYDCSDFRLVNLIRIMYEFEDRVPASYKSKIEGVLFNFRYWLDEPGENSMCYWSENHQILFASAEFLIGQKYPNVMFPNSGLTGNQHMEKAKVRILDWLKMRWDYGFTEFYSNVYYKEDIAALINLIDFAGDEEIVKKSQIIMDLLFFDVATQSTKNMFISASGRAYEGNRKGGPGATLGGLTQYFWGDGSEIGAGMMYGMMVSKNYQLPPVLKEIAQDSSEVIIKQSNGLNISELKAEGYYEKDNRSLMMQWGMEAFVNPSVVRNSLSNIRTHQMFSNGFLKDFKVLDFSLLRILNLEPTVVKLINPQYIGTAIQKGDTYTYKTKDFSMYTVQNHQIGDFADQQHVFGINVKNHFAVFHTHPAVEKNVKVQSPNYWVGYGHFPHSAQEKNINLSIYNIPDKKGIMEKDLLDYTHSYFPKEKFDSTYITGNYIFGKKEDTYCAFIGTNAFKYRDNATDDIIQTGKQVYWIAEASSKAQDGSFKEFIDRVKNNKVIFDGQKLELSYYSNNNKYELRFGSDFKVNDQVINTAYLRFDSPYLKSDKKAKTYQITMNGQSLYLDFENGTREF